jgi:hypothetical protein
MPAVVVILPALASGCSSRRRYGESTSFTTTVHHNRPSAAKIDELQPSENHQRTSIFNPIFAAN